MTEGLLNKAKSAFLASLLGATVACGAVHEDVLYKQIAKHEGVKSQVYRDSLGNLTIGIGFNLNDTNNRKILSKLGISFDDLIKGRRLTPNEIKALYNASLQTATTTARQFLPNLSSYPEPVQRVIIDMSFNMGYNKLSQFKKFKAALIAHDYKTASKEMLNSTWAKQVHGRATELAKIIASS